MATENTPILQEGCKFCKKTAKNFVLPPKLQKVRFEVHKKFMNFKNIYGKVGWGIFGHPLVLPNLIDTLF